MRCPENLHRCSCTSGVFAFTDGSVSPLTKRSRASGPMALGSDGCELKASPSTTSMSGSRSINARTCQHSNHALFSERHSEAHSEMFSVWTARPKSKPAAGNKCQPTNGRNRSLIECRLCPQSAPQSRALRPTRLLHTILCTASFTRLVSRFHLGHLNKTHRD